MTKEKSKPRVQCAKCPWKKSTDPYDIPNGYSKKKHENLSCTIATPGDFHHRRMMACHETPPGAELPCVGWLVHQLGPGNNIGLRLLVITGQVDANVATVGPQHECFEDTLPKKSRRKPGGCSQKAPKGKKSYLIS